METLELVLLLLAAVLVSAVIDQIVPKVSRPLIQIAIGVVIALFSFAPISIEWDSELFLVLFIAPLLYDEARNADLKSLWEDRGIVLSLAVGLVVTSTFVVGFAVNAVIPAIPLAAAFALGAALGPTDAVAVASLPRSVNIGDHRRGILKGESLINDASGIVCFAYAMQFAMGYGFAPGEAILTFLVEFFGGIALGVALAWVFDLVASWVRGLGLENSTFHVLYDLFVPFMVFLAAERVGVGGVLAVVACGLTLSALNRDIGPRAARLNIVSANVWRVFTFALNGVVFVLLGTQLPKAMASTWEEAAMGNGQVILFAIVLSVIVVGVRFIWVWFMEARIRHHENLPAFNRETLRSAAIMTFGGAKGAITLSIMFTIPVLLDDGSAFPQRELIIFLACCVILITLLLACFVVPLFAEKSNPSQEEEERRLREAEAKIEIGRRVIEELSARQTPANRRATQSVIHQYNRRIARIKSMADIEDELNVELRVTAIGWERNFVKAKLRDGEIDETVAYDVLAGYDRREALVQHSTRAWRAEKRVRRQVVHLRTRWRNARKRIPGLSVSERSEQARAVRIGAIEDAVRRLREELPADTYPTEDVAAVQYDYLRTLSALRSKGEKTGLVGMTGFTRTASKAEDIKREAYRIELEAIQEMYDDGRISRSTARRMRENVALMQIDAEGRV